MTSGDRLDAVLARYARFARALADYHRQHGPHGALRPEAVGDDLDDLDDAVALLPPKPWQGEAVATLRYASPTVAGRLDELDPRDDLYSLGVMLFEALAGRPPFASDDPLELVHQHMAVAAPALVTVVDDVPDVVSAIVAKLLEKSPARRYRSADALAHDLDRAAAEWRARGVVSAFELDCADLDRDDTPDVALPDGLYGRDAELHRIGATIAGARPSELCLVRGPAGSGKSALLRAVRTAALAGGALCADVKHSGQAAAPYASVTTGVAGVLEQVLSRPPEEVALWRERLIEYLAELTPVLCPLIPELQLVIGPQPAPAPLDGEAAQVRMHAAFRRLFRAMASFGPVVCFLDDLQWADAATLDLIEYLVMGAPVGNVVGVGAYRDTEVDAGRPLARFLGRLRSGLGAAVHEIELRPLAVADVEAFLRDAFGDGGQSGVRELAELTVTRTGGNPFYVRQFIRAVVERGGVRRDGAGWRWNVAALGSELGANVAEQMAAELEHLPPATRSALRCGAAVGREFDTAVLAAVLAVDTDAADALLAPATAADLITPVGADGTYRFVHDRVMAAAYAGLDDASRSNLHLSIATALADLTERSGDERQHLFTLADHVNLGRAALADEAARLRAAELNARAGRAALAAADLDAAGRYFAAGITLLPGDAWTRAYRLAYDLHLGAAESDRSHQRRVARLTAVLESAAPGTDRLRAAARLVPELNMVDRVRSAALAFECAASSRLVDLPESTDAATLFADTAAWLRERFGGRRPAEVIAELPLAVDPEVGLVATLLGAAGDAGLVADRPTMCTAAALGVRLAFEHGISEPTARLFALFAAGLIEHAGTTDEARAVAEAAEAIEAANPSNGARVRTLCIWAVDPWWRPIGDMSDEATATFDELASTSGGARFAPYAGLAGAFASFCHGRSVADVWRHRERVDDLLAQRGFPDPVVNLLRPLEAAARALAGLTRSPTELDAAFDLDRFVVEYADLPIAVAATRTAQIVLAGLDDRHHDVLACADDPSFAAVGPVLPTTTVLFWRGIAHAGLAAGSVGAIRAAHLAGLDGVLETLARYAASGAQANIEHRLAFLRGERARVVGEDPNDHYRVALGRALHHEFVLEYGYLLERYGRWLAEVSPANSSAAYELAIGAYRAAQAHGLAARLERQLIAVDDPGLIPIGSAAERFDRVDAQAILGAVQTITSERDFASLLDRLLTIIVSATGAERGAIVLRTDDQVMVEVATGDMSAGLPLGMVRFVLNTGQAVVVHDVTSPDGSETVRRFGAADVVAAGRATALACLPIGRRPPYRRALYLDHTTLTGLFAQAGRRRLLGWLTDQAAISLDHIESYDELEQRVRLRTRELSAANELLRRHQADLRRAKEEAEAAARAKSDFLANMSHEVRTPMSVILGLTELLLRDAADPLQRDRLSKLELSAEILLGILDDILDYSKIEAGKLEVEHTAFDLAAVVAGAVRLSEDAAADKGLALRCDIVDVVPPAVLGDPLRLGQVLRNLLSNAVKFTARGRIDVTVRCEPAEPIDGAPAVHVELAVDDEGVGMSAAEVSRLFQPFTQADASTSRRFGGTGLGLAITARLVELMGGRIDVASEVGVGTRFTVHLDLPVTDAVADHDPQRRPRGVADGTLAGVRVLLVEDNELNREVAASMLHVLGADVTVAADGRAAVDAVAEDEFDVILMDCQMPLLDGFEATARIRALDGGADVPILAMTANALQGDRDRALDAGMNGHVGKPVTTAQLAQAVRAWTAPPATADELRAAAPLLYGFDVEEALERVPDVELLGRLVTRFGLAHVDTADRLRVALAAGALDQIETVTHTLAGSAGMLAMVAVEAAARHVCSLARARTDGAPLVELAIAVDALECELARTQRTLAMLAVRAPSGAG